jgi:hypothetical protein
MKLSNLSALFLVLAHSALATEALPGGTNAAATQFTPAMTALIANARAVASDLKLPAPEQNRIANLEQDGATGAREVIERVLPAHTLFRVNINPEMRVKVNPGNAPARLVAGEWHYFLARIENESGTTAPLQISVQSPAHVPQPVAWLEAELVARTNLPVTLSGAPLEYRVVKLRSRESGRREARISLHVGQGTQDLGFRNEVDILFTCEAKSSGPEPASSKNEIIKE